MLPSNLGRWDPSECRSTAGPRVRATVPPKIGFGFCSGNKLGGEIGGARVQFLEGLG